MGSSQCAASIDTRCGLATRTRHCACAYLLEFATWAARASARLDDAGRAVARYRAKLAEIVHPERVLADLSSTYDRAYLADQDAIRAGVKKLMRRWDKAAAATGTGRRCAGTARPRSYSETR